MIEHGTPQGYDWHIRNKNKSCDACRDANANVSRARRGVPLLSEERPPTYWRAKKAVAISNGDMRLAAEASAGLTEANLRTAIRKAVSGDLPLTADQKIRLISLLIGDQA